MNRFCAVDDPIVDRREPPWCADPDGFDPAPGSVSAKEATTSPVAIAFEPAGLLLVGAEPDEHLAGDAVVGAEHRPQRQRRVAQLHRQFDVLGQVQAEATPLLRDRVAEQPHLLGLLAQIVGDPVVGEDLLLARHDRGADELTGLGQDLLEVVVADFGSGHRTALLFGEWDRRPAKSYMKYDVPI